MPSPSDSELNLLAYRAGEQLLRRKLKAATAESCTGGLVSKLLTDVPGSSQWFECGYVCYSNRAKERDLEVAPETLREFGAVSEPTVTRMAMGALARSGADRAVAISGVAGPDGGSADHPVGEVWFALAMRSATTTETRAVRRLFSGDRDAVRRQSAALALQLLMEP